MKTLANFLIGTAITLCVLGLMLATTGYFVDAAFVYLMFFFVTIAGLLLPPA